MEKLTTRHFSHDHPLQRTGSPPRLTSTCFGCNLLILPRKGYYKCKSCPFSLHQVCYNMPRKAQHPADPNHYFTLQTTPPSTKESLNCKACGQNITGFHYFCGKCGDYYHTLCSVVPLSVKMPSHLHTLKLEFSPPYDFECDFCKKPSFNGWLYRCKICEFDAHLACAITNNSAKWLEPVQMDKDLDSKGHELMELITMGFKGTEGDRSQQHDQMSLLFSDDVTLPSCQFSDLCFSIDFAKSLLGDEYKGQNEVEDDIPQVRVVMTSQNKDSNQINSTGKAWMELGQDTKTRKSKGAGDHTDYSTESLCCCWGR